MNDHWSEPLNYESLSSYEMDSLTGQEWYNMTAKRLFIAIEADQ